MTRTCAESYLDAHPELVTPGQVYGAYAALYAACGVCVLPTEVPIPAADTSWVPHELGLIGVAYSYGPPLQMFVAESGRSFYYGNRRLADGPVPLGADGPLLRHLPPLVRPVPGTNLVWIVDAWTETLNPETAAGATDVALFELSVESGFIKTSWRATLGYASLEAVALADRSLVLRGEPSGDHPHLVRVAPQSDGTTSISGAVGGAALGVPSWLREMWRLDGDRIAVLGQLQGEYGRETRGDRWGLVILDANLAIAVPAIELVDPSVVDTLPNEFPQLQHVVEEWDGSHTLAFAGASNVDPAPAPLGQCWVSRMRPDGTFITPSPGLLVNPVDYSSVASSLCATSARTADRVEARYSVVPSTGAPSEYRRVLVASDFASTSPLLDSACSARVDGSGTVFDVCSTTTPRTVRRYDTDEASTQLGPIHGERCTSNPYDPVILPARTEGLWVLYGDDATDVDGNRVFVTKVTRMHADGRIGWTSP